MRENTKKNVPSSFLGGWHLSIHPGYHPTYEAKQEQKGRTRFPMTADNLAFSL